jgi:hypothetical protein
MGMGLSVVTVASGGLPVVVSPSGLPAVFSTNGYGLAVTQAANGIGLPLAGITFGPDVTAPIITSTNAITNVSGTMLAHTLTANEAVTWAIVAGGVDNARFEISGSTLRWLGNGVKNVASPNDSDLNNTYIVTVKATDLASNPSTTQTITVTVVSGTVGQAFGLLLALTKAT